MRSKHDNLIEALPQDWPVRTLTEIADRIESGGTPSRAVLAYWGGGISWVTPGELTNLGLKHLHETRESISVEGLSASGATLLPKDALLVTTRATLGSVVLAGRPLATNQGFKSIVFDRSIDPSFYFHFFRMLLQELARRASGTTFLEISGKQFGQIEAPVPPLMEQRRIAEILDMVDRAIRSKERLIAKLEQTKRGLLHDLLTRGIDESGHVREPQRHPDQFKESILGRIPINWSVQSVGEACSLVQDGTHLPPPRVSVGPLLLSVRNMVGGKFVQTDADTRIPWSFFHAMHRAWKIRSGDVLLAVVGATVGKTARVDELPPFTVQRSITVLRGNQDVLDNEFLFEVLSAPEFQRQIRTVVNQTAQPGIYLAELRKLHLPVPPADEQRQICERSAAVKRQSNSALAELRKLRLLKQGLANDLLTGRVRAGLVEEASA